MPWVSINHRVRFLLSSTKLPVLAGVCWSGISSTQPFTRQKQTHLTRWNTGLRLCYTAHRNCPKNLSDWTLQWFVETVEEKATMFWNTPIRHLWTILHPNRKLGQHPSHDWDYRCRPQRDFWKIAHQKSHWWWDLLLGVLTVAMLAINSTAFDCDIMFFNISAEKQALYLCNFHVVVCSQLLDFFWFFWSIKSFSFRNCFDNRLVFIVTQLLHSYCLWRSSWVVPVIWNYISQGLIPWRCKFQGVIYWTVNFFMNHFFWKFYDYSVFYSFINCTFNCLCSFFFSNSQFVAVFSFNSTKCFNFASSMSFASSSSGWNFFCFNFVDSCYEFGLFTCKVFFCSSLLGMLR